jgi:uncharacterized membrane protein
MGPLSAVAIAFYLVILALTNLGSVTASVHALGWIGIIAAVVILLDAFVIGSGRRWTAWRERN